MNFSEKFVRFCRQILPNPFSIAILLTAVVFIVAMLVQHPDGSSNRFLDLLESWENGLWNSSKGGLYFAFQMMLMLVLGYVLALSPPVSRLINTIISPLQNTAQAAFAVTLSTLIMSFLNWGLGLVFGAILARKIGENFHSQQKALNYPLIGACAYSGLMVWHGGLSGSAPIKAAEADNLKDLVEGIPDINLSAIPNRIGMEETVFSPMNLTVSAVLLIVLPYVMYRIGKSSRSHTQLPQPDSAPSEKASSNNLKGAERLDHSYVFAMLIAIIILAYAGYKAFVKPDRLGLEFLTPNFINFVLLGLGLGAHFSVHNFIQAAGKAVQSATGILLQFPLYFGIMGIMVSSGLISTLSDWFTTHATPTTFPISTFFSAGLVNLFIPSGGGQWAIQGPIIIAAAQDLNLSYSKTIMALSYGDQLTNMLQPFWALPLLGITGLKAKDILPYTLILFVFGLFLFLSGLILF